MPFLLDVLLISKIGVYLILKPIQPIEKQLQYLTDNLISNAIPAQISSHHSYNYLSSNNLEEWPTSNVRNNMSITVPITTKLKSTSPLILDTISS